MHLGEVEFMHSLGASVGLFVPRQRLVHPVSLMPNRTAYAQAYNLNTCSKYAERVIPRTGGTLNNDFISSGPSSWRNAGPYCTPALRAGTH
jgi:hypothetical protein